MKYHDVVSGGEGITLVLTLRSGSRAGIKVSMLIFQNTNRSYPIIGLSDKMPGVPYRTKGRDGSSNFWRVTQQLKRVWRAEWEKEKPSLTTSVMFLGHRSNTTGGAGTPDLPTCTVTPVASLILISVLTCKSTHHLLSLAQHTHANCSTERSRQLDDLGSRKLRRGGS